MIVESVKQILIGEPVKGVISIDAPSVVRKNNPNIITRLIYMLKTLSVIKKRAQEVNAMLANIDS